ncbi:MAG TPA: FlxA-like family protein [Steroidobacteraceae bacterium]|nr:FlxA-like family protein [Steroidobacteraceae bacterium]
MAVIQTIHKNLQPFVSAAGALALLTGDYASAATQEELEAKVQALSDQLQEVQKQLAELKQQQVQRPAEAAPAIAQSQSAASTSADQTGQPTWFGYGELNYSRPQGRSADAQADLGRFVIGMEYGFDDRTRFVSEVEVEHAVSSSDDPGEVEIEQAYIERELGSGIFGRAGLFLIPSGLLNESHEPTRYYGVFRNLVETAIIPTTWREGGIAVQGRTDSGLRWDIGVTTGFDLSKWDASAEGEGQESPLGSIHQELALARAADASAFGALNYSGVAGLLVGGSIFTGGAGQAQPGYSGSKVTLWETHARWSPAAFQLSALYAHGSISKTARINTTLVGNPMLIPEEFFGWYVEAAYRAIERDTWSLAPFVRYERVNTGSSYADIGQGFTPSALGDQKVWTGGLNLWLSAGVVLKADYLDFRDERGADRIDLGIGYAF